MNRNRTSVFIGVLTGVLVGFVFGAAFGSPDSKLETGSANGAGDVTSLPSIFSRLNTYEPGGTAVLQDGTSEACDSLRFVGRDQDGNEIDIIIVNK